ncbi:DUF6445 family protein [Shewanella woodyi]|uniref:DUF6445 family protein n=1 Tax=Shewanella woodyi TaxID=60961 RepID=UPI0007F94F09|nr:DUF6445 family protein [Shewanella woodyi]
MAADLLSDGSVIFNPDAKPVLHTVGEEKTPLLIIDDLLLNPDAMVRQACRPPEFSANNQDFYPGKRKAAPLDYDEQLIQRYSALIRSSYRIGQSKQPNTLQSAFSLTMTKAEALRPIQMLPHFDSPSSDQFAVVHYLFNAPLGGTSLYRHRESRFESITHERLPLYGKRLKQQAYGMQLHQNPAYTNGSSPLFEQIHSVEATFNRAIIYPSNCLHSADISADNKLTDNPATGRLTLNSFILFK